MFKVRFLWVLLVFFLGDIFALSAHENSCTAVVDTTEKDSLPKPMRPNGNPGFFTKENAIDSLMDWMFNRKSLGLFGLLAEVDFVDFVRLVDTVSPQIIVNGQYVQYRYRHAKGIQKLQKFTHKNALNKKNVQRVGTVISYKSSGPFSSHRVEFEIQKKKQRFTVRFELIERDGVFFWINACQIYENELL